MTTTTLQDRLTVQLTPIASLMDEIIDSAYAKCSTKRVIEAWPELRRSAHQARV